MRNATFAFVLLTALMGNLLPLPAASCYWNNASGDSRWSNPLNWVDQLKPGPGDMAYLGNNAPNAPQDIILDETISLDRISCTATGNRHYTITPQANEVIELTSTEYPLFGNNNRKVNLTINAPLHPTHSLFHVYCYGNAATTTLTRSISPPPDSANTTALRCYGPGTLTLAASNTLTDVLAYQNMAIIVQHPDALGQGLIRTHNATTGVLLEFQTDATIHGALQPSDSYPILMRIAATGERNITLTHLDRTLQGEIKVLPRGPNATGSLTIRYPEKVSAHLATFALPDYASLRFEHQEGGAIALGGSNYSPNRGAVSGAGKIVIDTSQSVSFFGTNTYTGGTWVYNGTATAINDDTLPTNGVIYLAEGTKLSGYTGTRSHHYAGLVGSGSVESGLHTITTLLSPGGEQPGTLSFTTSAVLGPECVTTFKLDALDGSNDLIISSGSSFTIDGTLRIVNQGNLESGTYTLFQMGGRNRIIGAFKTIELPPRCTGVVEVDATTGHLQLHLKRPVGTLLLVR